MYPFPPFGKTVSNFGQGLGWGNPYRHRDTGSLLNSPFDSIPKILIVSIYLIIAVKLEESFIYGVDFDIFCQHGEHFHHPGALVPI